MKSLETRSASRRKMLALLLIFTANIFFSQVAAMAQSQAPQEPTGETLDIDDYWTVTGSTGTVEDKDLAFVDVNFNYFGHKISRTGTVHIRYNIVAVEGANQEGFNGTQQVRVRFRDSDGHGPNARVAFDIWRTNISNGVDNKIFSFDSNIDGADVSPDQTVTLTDCEPNPDFDFDFSQYIYWIEAEVKRVSSSGVARLSIIQITELPTPCSGSPTISPE